jgi:hypothetical protein
MVGFFDINHLLTTLHIILNVWLRIWKNLWGIFLLCTIASEKINWWKSSTIWAFDS